MKLTKPFKYFGFSLAAAALVALPFMVSPSQTVKANEAAISQSDASVDQQTIFAGKITDGNVTSMSVGGYSGGGVSAYYYPSNDPNVWFGDYSYSMYMTLMGADYTDEGGQDLTQVQMSDTVTVFENYTAANMLNMDQTSMVTVIPYSSLFSDDEDVKATIHLQMDMDQWAGGQTATWYENIIEIQFGHINSATTSLVTAGVDTMKFSFEYESPTATWLSQFDSYDPTKPNIEHEVYTGAVSEQVYIEVWDADTEQEITSLEQTILPEQNGYNSVYIENLEPGKTYYIKFSNYKDYAGNFGPTYVFQSPDGYLDPNPSFSVNGYTAVSSNNITVYYTWSGNQEIKIYWALWEKEGYVNGQAPLQTGDMGSNSLQRIDVSGLTQSTEYYFTASVIAPPTTIAPDANTETITVETLPSLSDAPIQTQAGPDGMAFQYYWNDINPGTLFWKAEQINNPLANNASGAASVTGGQGYKEISTQPSLKIVPNEAYRFYFSTENNDWGGSSSEFVTIAYTTDGLNQVYLNTSDYFSASFGYVYNSNFMGSTPVVYYEVTSQTEGDFLTITGDFVPKYGAGIFDIYEDSGVALTPGTDYIINFSQVPMDTATDEDLMSIEFRTKTPANNVQSSDITATSAKISYDWNSELNNINGSGNGAIPSYKVYTDEEGSFDNAPWVEITPEMLVGNDNNPDSTGNHSFYISDLQPSTTYHIVIGNDPWGGSGWSEVHTFTTLGSIRNATFEITSSTSILVSYYWDPGNNSSNEVYLWIGDPSLDPYAMGADQMALGDPSQGTYLNQWIWLTDPNDNVFGYSPVAYQTNYVPITGLSTNVSYQLRMASDPTDPSTDILIENLETSIFSLEEPGSMPYWGWVAFIGIIAVILIALGIWKVRNRES